MIRRTGKPFECPVCGEEVPADAKACPECGACEKSGWNEEFDAAGLDLPDEDFDYDQYVKDEFGGNEVKPPGLHWFWWLVALLLLIAVVLVCI